jgi:hypothetical protein
MTHVHVAGEGVPAQQQQQQQQQSVRLRGSKFSVLQLHLHDGLCTQVDMYMPALCTRVCQSRKTIHIMATENREDSQSTFRLPSG